MSTATAIIDLDRLTANARAIAGHIAPARVIAVVKADAYGHGAVPVARALSSAGIGFFAVASVDEGKELREAGIDGRILIMSAMMPASIPRYVRYNLEATIGSSVGLESASSLVDSGRPLRVHIKVDTGMARIGLPAHEAVDAAMLLERSPGVSVDGISTHLASADEDDTSFSSAQLGLFRDMLSRLRQSGFEFGDRVVHVGNTEAISRDREVLGFPNTHVRAGIGLYGCPIRADTRRILGVQPVMTLRALVANIKRIPAGTPVSYNGRWTSERDTFVATIGIGYADGYPRSLSGVASVALPSGRLAPVVGTICMDMLMADLGPDEPDVAVGEEATLFGEGGPDIHRMSDWAETIPYEVTARLGKRVIRRYTPLPSA